MKLILRTIFLKKLQVKVLVQMVLAFLKKLIPNNKKMKIQNQALQILKLLNYIIIVRIIKFIIIRIRISNILYKLDFLVRSKTQLFKILKRGLKSIKYNQILIRYNKIMIF